MRTPILRILAVALFVSLSACGDSDPGNDAVDAADVSDAVDTTTPDVASDTVDTPDTPDTIPADTDDADISSDADSAEAETAMDTTELPDSSPDTAADTNPADTTQPDTTQPDTTQPDTTQPDTETPDTSLPDAADTSPVRQTLIAGFCPSNPTAPGLYRGTLASNLNDVAGACGLSAPGRDGGVRVNLEPGQTLRADYRHASDGIIYLLDSCPVVATCLVSSDTSMSGEESIEWTNTGSVTNPVTIILDSDDLGGPQTFELDLYVTGP